MLQGTYWISTTKVKLHIVKAEYLKQIHYLNKSNCGSRFQLKTYVNITYAMQTLGGVERREFQFKHHFKSIHIKIQFQLQHYDIVQLTHTIAKVFDLKQTL